MFAAWGNTAWLGVLNPGSVPLAVRVAILREGGQPPLTEVVSVPARGRAVVGLHTWVRDEAFGVEVECAAVCGASLVMWDSAFATPHESIPTGP